MCEHYEYSMVTHIKGTQFGVGTISKASPIAFHVLEIVHPKGYFIHVGSIHSNFENAMTEAKRLVGKH